MGDELKKKKTLLLSVEIIEKLKTDSKKLGVSMNQVAEKAIANFKTDDTIKALKRPEFKPCPLKYGQKG